MYLTLDVFNINRCARKTMQRYPYIDPHLIGFDIDCVVADTMEAFIRLAAEEYNIKIRPEEITSFQVEKCLAINPEIIEEIFLRLLTHPRENDLKPMPQAVEVLTRLAAQAPVSFITARPVEAPIAAWLESTLPADVYQSARLVATGSHDGKADFIKNLGLEYFVDDRLNTCRELAGAGLSPVVFSQPWNRGRHSLASADNWEAIEKGIRFNGTDIPKNSDFAKRDIE